MTTDANSLALIADASAIGDLLSADNGLVVRIYNQAGAAGRQFTATGRTEDRDDGADSR